MTVHNSFPEILPREGAWKERLARVREKYAAASDGFAEAAVEPGEDFYRALLETGAEENHVDQSDKELVLQSGSMKLYHYKNPGDRTVGTPMLITYALINRQYMMDLQPDRSVIGRLVKGGLDVYSIDWGYPTRKDLKLSLDDYVNSYMDLCVDCIRERSGCAAVNLLGVCQGGVFSLLYTALHREKIKNLVTMVVPIDFDSRDALLFRWCKKVNVEALVQAYGVVSGDYLNHMFLYLKPFELNVDKYRNLAETGWQDRASLASFLRMERWTFDCPDEAGAMLVGFMGDLFQKNLLCKGGFRLGDKAVDLTDVTCPLLCICGERDHIVPISATKPLFDLVGSKDREFVSFQTGHIGMYVSTKSQNLIAPKILSWLEAHD